MINPKKISHHIDHLESKHQKLDKEIKILEEHRSNHEKIVNLKKEKLRLKDEILKFKKSI